MNIFSGIFVKRNQTDPVCGMKTAESISAQHAGRTYYFCSEHCRQQFQTDPKSYVKESIK